MVLDSYTQGLRDAGWHGDPAQVRYAFAAGSALRYSWARSGSSCPSSWTLEPTGASKSFWAVPWGKCWKIGVSFTATFSTRPTTREPCNTRLASDKPSTEFRDALVLAPWPYAQRPRDRRGRGSECWQPGNLQIAGGPQAARRPCQRYGRPRDKRGTECAAIPVGRWARSVAPPPARRSWSVPRQGPHGNWQTRRRRQRLLQGGGGRGRPVR
jgi:hypothetical protein